MTNLIELAERVESGAGEDRELDATLYALLVEPIPEGKRLLAWAGCYTSSLDAVVELLERVMPGAAYVLNVFDVQRKPERIVHAKAHVSDTGLGSGTLGEAGHPARALLAAILRALAAKAK